MLAKILLITCFSFITLAAQRAEEPSWSTSDVLLPVLVAAVATMEIWRVVGRRQVVVVPAAAVQVAVAQAAIAGKYVPPYARPGYAPSTNPILGAAAHPYTRK